MVGEATDQHTGKEPGNPLRMLTVGLISLEALVLVGLALYLVVELVRADTSDARVAAAGMGLLALIGGVGLAVCARGVARAQSWTRGPVFTWQLVQAFVALPVSTGSWLLGAPLLLVAVVTGLLIIGGQVVPRPDRLPG